MAGIQLKYKTTLYKAYFESSFVEATAKLDNLLVVYNIDQGAVVYVQFLFYK